MSSFYCLEDLPFWALTEWKSGLVKKAYAMLHSMSARERQRGAGVGWTYMEDEVVPLGNDVAEWTAVIRLTEWHSTVHTPTHTTSSLDHLTSGQ